MLDESPRQRVPQRSRSRAAVGDEHDVGGVARARACELDADAGAVPAPRGRIHRFARARHVVVGDAPTRPRLRIVTGREHGQLVARAEAEREDEREEDDGVAQTAPAARDGS